LAKSKEVKEKISKSLTGRKLSESHKNKIKNYYLKKRDDFDKVVGILKGKFDPPHNGHLSVALSALAISQMNEIWWIPSCNDTIESSFNRIKMINQIIKPYKKFRCIDFEIKNKLDGSYSSLIKELYRIKRHYKTCFYLIIGSDEALEIEKKDNSWLLENVRFCIFYRKGFKLNKEESVFKDDKHLYITDEFIVNNISSDIIQDGKYSSDIIRFLPKSIQNIIEKEGFYARTDDSKESV
jgi:nicotinate-nucleotide adenylyltransferase